MTASPVKNVTTTHVTTGRLLERLTRLNLADVPHRFAFGPGTALSQHVVNKISFEYHRFSLLRLVNPRREITCRPDTRIAYHT